MADVERISEELARDVRLAGWSYWVDTSTQEPFDAWLTPPGIPGFTHLKFMSPLEMVSKLDALNDPDDRLTLEEAAIVADSFFNIWFCRDVMRGTRSYFYDPTAN